MIISKDIINYGFDTECYDVYVVPRFYIFLFFCACLDSNSGTFCLQMKPIASYLNTSSTAHIHVHNPSLSLM